MSEISRVRGEILTQFTKEMQKKGLYAAGLGGGEREGKINLIDACFDAHMVMDLETARKLIIESTNILLDIINNNFMYHKYFEDFPVSNNILHISIIGQKLTNNTTNNYVEFVSIANGTITYSIDSEKPRFPPLIRIHEETFEEAKNNFDFAYNGNHSKYAIR